MSCKILGLNIGHNSTACLLIDGKIVDCISEERFSRIKNHHGIPEKSIEYILKRHSLNIREIDLVVLDDHNSIVKNNPRFQEGQEHSFRKKSFAGRAWSYMGFNYPDKYYKILSLKKSVESGKYEKIHNALKSGMSKELEFPENKILLVDHHYCHALSTCFNLNKKEKTLIFTLDGEGSGLCASVNIFDGKELKKISSSDKTASLGWFYALVTIYLGMKPLEHEFKVMGLAPYAKKDKGEKAYQKLRELFYITDSLEIKSRIPMQFFYMFLDKEFKFTRFDNLAYATQKLTEELCCEWVLKAIKKTGIHNVALTGGVFMNVKANQRISELKEVKKIFVMPSCGDESNAIGSCFFGYKRYCKENKIPFNPQPFKDLYLGSEYDNNYIENYVKRKYLDKRFIIKKVKDINKVVAKLLADGNIVARCSGRSEWGARSLGNRSILANPSNPEVIAILNETIKDRDFWMPFTPSILDKYERAYILNPKKIFAPYMVITFNSTNEAKKDISAAIHPYDKTVRPQIVTKEYNQDYYEIIEEFSKLTGIGGVLNTSFNLHGEPNVLTPEDAIHTVENSSLKYLAMENYLFIKK